MDVLFDIDENLIKMFQIVLVFLNVAFWNWLYGGAYWLDAFIVCAVNGGMKAHC
jgi:hypothetical protein